MPEQSAADRLRALAKGDQHRPDSARLRDLLADVEAALDAGVSRAAILAELHSAGFTFTQRSFESALYRARKKQKRHEIPTPKVSAGPTATAPIETGVKPTRRITNPGDLNKSMTNRAIDLEDPNAPPTQQPDATPPKSTMAGFTYNPVPDPEKLF